MHDSELGCEFTVIKQVGEGGQQNSALTKELSRYQPRFKIWLTLTKAVNIRGPIAINFMMISKRRSTQYSLIDSGQIWVLKVFSGYNV